MSGTIPQPPLGPNTTFLHFRPTMRNVFGGLSFNLTRVAAEGAPGTSSHDCYNHSGAKRGNLNLVPYISMCKISSSAPSQVVCVCAFICSVWCAAAGCRTHLVTPLWFPREATRFLLLSNIWFITIWNSTSVRLLCLKKFSQNPKEQGGEKNPPKRHCLEIDSCYCGVPSGAFAMEQKRVNILWCVVAVAQPLLHSQCEIPGARSLCTRWRENLNISMAPYQPMWLI